MIYGYARCSTNETKQDINRQLRELKAAGAEEVYFEYEHGDSAVKAKQVALFDMVKAGDTIITLEVPRLARSTKQLCEIIEQVKENFHFEESFNILLIHRPENFEHYADLGFDLVLAGHAHGGQWRIPGLLNGLYCPGEGLFPKYAGGLYQIDGTTMIVSRGLAKESNFVPRIFNRPELVIIDIV